MPPCPADDTCLVYLVRHGATANNVARPSRLQGRRSNLGLSDAGQRQAEQTARFLANEKLTAIYTSPLRRAKQTAQLIAAPHGLVAEPVEELIEVDVGDWEGRPWDEIERADPEAYRRFMEDPAASGYVGGENLGQVHQRVLPAFERLLEANLGGHIVVVGHNVVNRVYLAHLLGLPIAKARGISQDNCGVNVVRYRTGNVIIQTTNAVFHLSAE